MPPDLTILQQLVVVWRPTGHRMQYSASVQLFFSYNTMPFAAISLWNEPAWMRNSWCIGRVCTIMSNGYKSLIKASALFTRRFMIFFSAKVCGMKSSDVTTNKSMSLSSVGEPYAYEPNKITRSIPKGSSSCTMRRVRLVLSIDERVSISITNILNNSDVNFYFFRQYEISMINIHGFHHVPS